MITLFETYEQMSEYTASIVAEEISNNPSLRIGLPTGSTPIGMYKNLIQFDLDWSNVKTYNLDEYEGISHSHPESYHMFMNKNLFLHVNLKKDNIHFPDDEYDKTISEFGGLDLTILGIGHNGHIAFNEPGTPLTSRTRKVDLSEETIRANSRFFNNIDEVPKRAHTMGMKTIRESKRIILIANGPDKWDIVNKCFNGDVTKDRPASVLQMHPNIEVFYAS
jgi:glucosamine-6-phosphate deaminase